MSGRKVRRDLMWAAASEFLDKAVGYLVLMALVRYFDKETMGSFFLAATLGSLLGIASEAGASKYLIREAARQPERSLGIFSLVLSLRLLLLGAGFLVFNGLVAWGKPELLWVFALTAVYTSLEALFRSFGALFLGTGRIAYRVIAGVSARLLLLVLVLLSVRFASGLATILFCYIAAHTFMLGVAAYLTHRHIGSFGLVWQPRAQVGVLLDAFPLFALALLEILHFKVDTLLLGWLSSYSAVAVYETGYKLLEVSRSVIRPVTLVFYPIFSELAGYRNWGQTRALYLRILQVVALLGGGIGLVGWLIAPWVVPALYSSAYREAIPVVKVLFLSAPVLFIHLTNVVVCNALNLEKRAVRIALIGVAVNVILNALAIPRWGPVGAAWTTLASEALMAGWLVLLVQGRLRAWVDGQQRAATSAPCTASGCHESTL